MTAFRAFAACFFVSLGAAAPTLSADFETLPAKPFPTAAASPTEERRVGLAALGWTEGRWRVEGTVSGVAVTGELSFTFAYERRTIFFHSVARDAAGRIRDEWNGAIVREESGSAWRAVSVDWEGDVREWEGSEPSVRLAVFRSTGARNRATAKGLRWTLRRNHAGQIDSFTDTVTAAASSTRTVLFGRLSK